MLQVAKSNRDHSSNDAKAEIARLAEAVEGLTAALSQPQRVVYEASNTDNSSSNAFVFDAITCGLRAVNHVAAPPLDLLQGIDRAKNTLLENTVRFAAGHSANNALLWGARGMGKSTLVKSIHSHLVENSEKPPALIEIHREDISSLPVLLSTVKEWDRTCILFCDDLSFNRPDQDFKALKSVLEGGLEGRPDNVIFYATSNRRHMLPRQMIDQESATGLHPNEAMDETIALSDRFGLWLGFHPCDQSEYLAIIEGYLAAFALSPAKDWQTAALNWSKTRGNRSGRTAWQFVQNLAGEMGQMVRF
jgi:predicted AAA+ superfamily ATPase